MSEAIHWVEAGDPDAARRHGLTLLAACGTTYVPHRKGVKSSLPSCAECEAKQGPILRQPGPRRASDDDPHFVYRHFDADDRLVYVGCTVDPRVRSAQHAQTTWWWPQVARTRLTVYPNKLHALRVERSAIVAEQPLWNVRHQDFAAWPVSQIRDARDMATRLDAPEVVRRRLNRLADAS